MLQRHKLSSDAVKAQALTCASQARVVAGDCCQRGGVRQGCQHRVVKQTLRLQVLMLQTQAGKAVFGHSLLGVV